MYTRGYREGLLLMRVGGKARLTVPPHLAWGKKGVSTKIGPESVVIFDVWLRISLLQINHRRLCSPLVFSLAIW